MIIYEKLFHYTKKKMINPKEHIPSIPKWAETKCGFKEV